LAKLKLLKSIGHNTVHSYLSLMNYVEDDYMINYLHKHAKANDTASINIDILNQVITPVATSHSIITESLFDLRTDFLRLLDGAGLNVNDLVSATVNLEFIKTNENIGRHYNCSVKIVDKNQKVHSISVKEWWK